MSDILLKLQPIFQDVFDDESLDICRESSGETIDDWDSLAQINLISAIEQEFGIRFTLGELETLEDVGDMIDLMENKVNNLQAIELIIIGEITYLNSAYKQVEISAEIKNENGKKVSRAKIKVGIRGASHGEENE